ncbi:MAG: MBL fold metallo-hydrolase [Anaerolineales bacterium]
MIRERVAEDVYVFTSELYAQVNAGAVIGPDWSILIDTLAYPEETREIRDFLEGRLEKPVRYLINTHFHADHTLGNFLFPEAIVVGHALTRSLLDTRGRKSLEEAKKLSRELREINIVLPEIIFDTDTIGFRVGKRTLQLIPLPGHSIDGIGVFLVEDRVLFSGDVMMPIPYIVDGDYDQILESQNILPNMKLENLVQGHGEVILRGEVPLAVKNNQKYLQCVRKYAKQAGRRRDPDGFLASIDVESCGKSRILLGGPAEELHQKNMRTLFRQLYPDRAADI